MDITRGIRLQNLSPPIENRNGSRGSCRNAKSLTSSTISSPTFLRFTIYKLGTNMEQMSSCLSTYIEQVLYGHDYPRSRNKIFDRGIYQFSPILEHGRINRILFYPGCFNPPHLGHLELLRHGFMESGRDLNIVAAIVLPLDDESLRGKFSKQGGTLILPKDERVRLWGDCSLNDWYWVFDRSETEWLIFQKRLSQVVTKAGFDIRWVWLCGPDHIKVDRTPIQAWGCKEYIVSDVGRSASFTSNTIDRLTSLKGYGAWEEIAPDVEILKKDATDCARWRCSGFMIDPRVARRNLNEGIFIFPRLDSIQVTCDSRS